MDNSVHSKNSLTPSRTQVYLLMLLFLCSLLPIFLYLSLLTKTNFLFSFRESISTNTSTATSPTIDVTNLPAVIKWGNTESYHYIGAPHHHLRMNIHLGTEEIPQLLFWFSVTVAVTVSPGSSMPRTKLLYFVIQGSLFDWSKYDTCLLLGPPTSGYSLDTSTAIKQAGISSDCTSIFRIHFQLLDHGTVFMPSTEEHAFTPISDNVLQLLTDLRSLSQTKEFWAYIPSEGSNLTNLRKRIDRVRGGTFTGDFTTQSVYKPSMVRNKWTNFSQFVKKKNTAKLNSDPLPAYTSGSQGTGIKRKDNHQSDNLDQAFIETESDEELYIEQERERKRSKISSDTTPNKSSKVQFTEPCSEDLSYLEQQFADFIYWVLNIDPRLEKKCEQVFSDLGGTVRCGDITRFNQMKSECMANIYCMYVKRGSEWVLRN